MVRPCVLLLTVWQASRAAGFQAGCQSRQWHACMCPCLHVHAASDEHRNQGLHTPPCMTVDSKMMIDGHDQGPDDTYPLFCGPQLRGPELLHRLFLRPCTDAAHMQQHGWVWVGSYHGHGACFAKRHALYCSSALTAPGIQTTYWEAVLAYRYASKPNGMSWQ